MLTAATIDAVLGDRRRVASALHEAHRLARRDISADLLNKVEYRVAQLLGVAGEYLAPADTDTTSAAAIDACINFAEQWVIDVASMPPTLVDDVRAQLGDDGLAEFTHGLLVIEQRIRLGIAWQRLDLMSGPHAPPDSAYEAPNLRSAMGEWQAAVVCLDTVDPITTELVRLRCANYHDCHT